MRRVIVTSKSAVPSRPIGERDLLALRTAHAGHGLVDGLALGRLAVDGDDVVAALEAGLLRGRAREDGELIMILPSSSSLTWTPMPTNDPERDWSAALASSAVMNEVWPSSPTASVMPRIAP